jgi:hypothetical protein
MLVAAPAAAQNDTPNYFRALGGVTFVTETSLVAGAGVGVPMGGNLDLYFEGGFIRSILPKDAIDIVEEILDDLDEDIVDLTVDAPSFYGFGGVRLHGGGRIQPFGEVLFGFIRSSLDFSATIGGIGFDLDDLPIDLGLSSTEAVLGLGGGVTIRGAGRTSFEIGWRWMRMLIEEPPNINKVYGAVRIEL